MKKRRFLSNFAAIITNLYDLSNTKLGKADV